MSPHCRNRQLTPRANVRPVRRGVVDICWVICLNPLFRAEYIIQSSRRIIEGRIVEYRIVEYSDGRKLELSNTKIVG